MTIQQVTDKSKLFFPDLKIKYKDQSLLMKIIGTIFFFNKKFMTDYLTTIGSVIYFPNQQFATTQPISRSILFLHELMHVSDGKRLNKFLFGFLYLCPQILFIFSLLLFFITWKLALPITVIFLLPLPAYFRMQYEKRAYMVSLYVRWQLTKYYTFDPTLDIIKNSYLEEFKGSSYYYMGSFNMEKEFNQAVIDITANRKPFEDPFFDIVDKLIPSI